VRYRVPVAPLARLAMPDPWVCRGTRAPVVPEATRGRRVLRVVLVPLALLAPKATQECRVSLVLWVHPARWDPWATAACLESLAPLDARDLPHGVRQDDWYPGP